MRFARPTQTETHSVSLRFVAAAAMWMALCPATPAQKLAGAGSGFITTADKTRIHYLEAGSTRLAADSITESPSGKQTTGSTQAGPTVLFVPGWTMPAWIWEHQITHFAKAHHVVAMDPRGQGESDKPREGYFPAQRARDIRALIEQLKLERVVLVGWSMGVAEVAAYIEQYGTDRLAAVVLVDGLAGGYDAQFTAAIVNFAGQHLKDRAKSTDAFVRSMYRKPQDEAYLQRVAAAALQTPTDAAMALMVGTFSSDHTAALAKIDKPALVVAAGDDKSNPWVAKYRDLAASIPSARFELFPDRGHALFADDPARFNSLLESMLVPKRGTTQ